MTVVKKSKKDIPVKTVHLFPILDKMLLQLLRSLNEEEWNYPTIARLWTVKDIAAHLLDGNIRMLSFSRDGYFGEKADNIHSYNDLVAYLNQLNHSWTDAARRMSPRVLMQLLESTGKQYCRQVKKLDPHKDAVFAVAWAGQEISPNWFHVAREYTEKFLHQQQVREAVGQQALLTRKLYRPFLDTFMQALPYTYRHTAAATGTIVAVIITGKAGGQWNIIKMENEWTFIKTIRQEPAATVKISPHDAWKLFSKGMSPAEAETKVELTGDTALGKTVLQMVSVMA